MDVTNPGLVNVADQACGNPSTSVQSLAIPEDSDTLVPVADEGYPRAEDASPSLPIPSSSDIIQQPPASPSQSSGQLPGVAPAFAPFPQESIANTVNNQPNSQNQAQPAQFEVIGVGDTIPTNQTPETAKQYVVTAVRDASGGPVIDPVAPVSGPFTDVFDGGAGRLIFLSLLPLPVVLTPGAIAVIAASVPSYSASQTVLDELAISGNYTDANKGNLGGTVTTFSSPIPFPVGFVDSLPVSILGANPYNGTKKKISNVTSLAGSFDEVANAGGGQIIVISHAAPLPAGLAAGKIVKLGGAYAAAGAKAASSVINDSGAIASIASVGMGASIRVTSTAPLPADLIAGQLVTIASVDYNGTYAISNVTANTFDKAVPFVADEVGTWTAFTFNLPIAYGSTYSGTWTSYTFDVAVNFGATANGAWTSYTFTTPGNYVGTSSGSFKIYINSPPPTSVFRLSVAPGDLRSFGLSMLGREITFGKAIPTAANRGATRFISDYGPDFITIEKTEFADQRVPVLADPVPGDVFTLNVQRQGSEVTTEGFGNTQDVTILPPPAINVPNAFPSMSSQGTIDVSTGPQPGAPIITGGVQVPTAITVQVADQATSVGLPVNVNI
jgi:hypothetical protein